MNKSSKNRISAIILAAGSGTRFSKEITKQRASILGKSVLYRTVKTFSDCDLVDSIVVVCRAEELAWVKTELAAIDKIFDIIVGGKTRAESARKGFYATPTNAEYVAIHDAARCLITAENICEVAQKAFVYGAATACTAVTDTLKIVEDDGFINRTVPREKLFSAQTPQIFEKTLYAKALESCSCYEKITDDNMLIETIGEKIYPVDIGRGNIKITTTDDLAYAEYILERSREMSEIRIGHGYDVHRFAEGRDLILGGVKIPYEKGLLGHSDADVLTHAIMDALLGACGLGDIGRHFPDSDESYKNVCSLTLLKKVAELLENNGYSVINIDSTIVLEQPKIAPYIDNMVDNIALILGIDRGRINIKATTEEHLGFTGRQEGASAHAVASVKK